jgi:hypothetical protein
MPRMVLVPNQGTVSLGIIGKLQDKYLTLQNGEEKVAVALRNYYYYFTAIGYSPGGSRTYTDTDKESL